MKLFFDSGSTDNGELDPDTLQQQLDSQKVCYLQYIRHYNAFIKNNGPSRDEMCSCFAVSELERENEILMLKSDTSK